MQKDNLLAFHSPHEVNLSTSFLPFQSLIIGLPFL